jgi:hypothetical protein
MKTVSAIVSKNPQKQPKSADTAFIIFCLYPLKGRYSLVFEFFTIL